MKECPSKRSWYVIYTRSRFENVVYESLLKKSIDAFLPTVRKPSKRRDRKVTLSVPLFPGYVFVKSALDSRENLDILKTAGVVGFVGTKSGPVPVDQGAVESLKIMVAATDSITTGTAFRQGDPVRVTSGPFAGISGRFIRRGGKDRVLVEISALGQFASVDVSAEEVTPSV